MSGQDMKAAFGKLDDRIQKIRRIQNIIENCKHRKFRLLYSVSRCLTRGSKLRSRFKLGPFEGSTQSLKKKCKKAVAVIQKQTEKGRKLLAALDKREKELKKEISFLENQTEMRRMDRLSTEELLEMCPPQYTDAYCSILAGWILEDIMESNGVQLSEIPDEDLKNKMSDFIDGKNDYLRALFEGNFN
ncbi:hypothetical protein V9T40_005089 [Parthenolecanium corni]|uniref:Uncharacterized protein n=1 Tax=Parthenolecanium corni TaxID=536013 RepID=A0AAN9TF55_9HEMI